MPVTIDAIDRKRIADAIAEAESRTSGEIVAVVTAASDSYRFIAFLWAAIAALIVPLPLMFITGWTGPDTATSSASLTEAYLLQLATFAIVAAGLLLTPLRIRAVPGRVKRARAHRSAVEQFLAQNLHTTRGRTGVLLFVSIAERYAEVIADEGIYAKVPAEVWDDVVRVLVENIKVGAAAEGFLQAVRLSGALLAEHFPPAEPDWDELPNHLIVLE